ncbi:hypothetical protein ACSDR0_38825 [Streptosporangium sp. G11]|uniref:hypothetical protein n=1 Tax=Streptosporangium sp. G11 TaxID=3436926 RepID=UPI003EBD9B9B
MSEFAIGDPVYVMYDPIAYGVIEKVRGDEYFCHLRDEVGDWCDWYPASQLNRRARRAT